MRSITATSISLSWSVSSGRVASWEVVWRPTDRGTEVTSGPLSGTTYTIHQLEPSTIYTLTVTATNVAGTNTSLPIIVYTGTEILYILSELLNYYNYIIIATGEFATSYPQEAGFEIAAGVVITLLALVIVAGMIVIVIFLYKSGRLHSIFKPIILYASNSKCLSSISRRRNSEVQLPFITSERYICRYVPIFT